MRASASNSKDLLAALGLSLCVHAGFAVAFGSVETQGARELQLVEVSTLIEGPDPAPDPEEPVRLGMERSEADTRNWLGFADPTEHSAADLGAEQSAMTPEPAPAGAERPAPPPLPPLPTPSEVGTTLAGVAESLVAAGADLLETSAAAAGTPPPKGPPPPVDPSSAAPPQDPVTAPTQADSAGPLHAQPGIKATKESAAAALKEAVSVKPGKVAAAQGLEIFTRRPRWSITTQVIRSPRNPVVQITFGRDGTAIDARFLSDGERLWDTGFKDVDEPLISALYQWTAKGEALRRLPEGDPRAGVTVTIRVLLVGHG